MLISRRFRLNNKAKLEPCADVIVSAAARRWSKKIGGANFFSKVPERNSFYPKKFLMTSVI